MKLGALFSGGKDSTYACYRAMKRNEISCLITIVSENPESYMYHTPNIKLTELQAKAMNIPHIIVNTKGEKERELNELKKAVKIAIEKYKIEGIVSGTIASSYQKKRIDEICYELGLESIAPLWQKEPLKLLKQMIRSGFEIIITAVAAPPLDEKWLGRRIDEKCISELIELNKKYKIHLAFEGGEGETFVSFCPIFSKKIKILENVKHWDAQTNSGWLEIKDARLTKI